MSGPSSKPKREAPKAPVFVPHPDDAADVRAGFEELARGEGIALTPDEVDRWAETGELPERVEHCTDERLSSPRGT